MSKLTDKQYSQLLELAREYIGEEGRIPSYRAVLNMAKGLGLTKDGNVDYGRACRGIEMMAAHGIVEITQGEESQMLELRK